MCTTVAVCVYNIHSQLVKRVKVNCQLAHYEFITHSILAMRVYWLAIIMMIMMMVQQHTNRQYYPNCSYYSLQQKHTLKLRHHPFISHLWWTICRQPQQKMLKLRHTHYIPLAGNVGSLTWIHVCSETHSKPESP